MHNNEIFVTLEATLPAQYTEVENVDRSQPIVEKLIIIKYLKLYQATFIILMLSCQIYLNMSDNHAPAYSQ